jgi:hypothetical protein
MADQDFLEITLERIRSLLESQRVQDATAIILDLTGRPG